MFADMLRSSFPIFFNKLVKRSVEWKSIICSDVNGYHLGLKPFCNDEVILTVIKNK